MLETLKSAFIDMKKDETGSLNVADALFIPILLGTLVFGGGGALLKVVNDSDEAKALNQVVDNVNGEYDTWSSSNPNASVDAKKEHIFSEIQKLPESSEYGIALDESSDNICLWKADTNRNHSNDKAITLTSRVANCTKMTVVAAPEGSVKPITDNADRGVSSIESKPSEPAPEFPWSMMLGILATAGVALGGGAGVIFSVKKAKANKRKRSTSRERWEALIKRHQTVRKEWAAYELDPMKMLEYPILTDMSEKVTSDLHLALKKANTLEPKNVEDVLHEDSNTSTYLQAVISLEHAFNVAKSEAERVQWTKFSADEQKRLKTAKALLSLVLDGGASEFERQSAYKQMYKELAGLIKLPSNTAFAIENSIRVMIEAQPTTEKVLA